MDNPLLRPDPGLFIWTIFTFLVLLAVLAKFAWGPLLKALESRQQSIRAALDDAQRAKQELERLEPLAATAFVLAGVARSVAAVGPGFADATRHTGVFLGLGALLLLSNLRGSSLLSFTPDVAMALYQVLFPSVAVALLWRALGNSDGIGVAIATGLLALFLVVRYKYESDTDLALDGAQFQLHSFPQFLVESGERLVQQQDLRLQNKGTGERNALHLASR